MKSHLMLTAAAATMAASAWAETPIIPHPGPPSAVARSGPAATMGPTAAPTANSAPAVMPVQPEQPAIPTQYQQPLNTLAPIQQPVPGYNPPTVQQKPVTSVLPIGKGTYTYYKDANTYYNPRTRTYYYQQSGEWRSGVSAPVGKHLGEGRTVNLNGESNVNGANN